MLLHVLGSELAAFYHDEVIVSSRLMSTTGMMVCTVMMMSIPLLSKITPFVCLLVVVWYLESSGVSAYQLSTIATKVTVTNTNIRSVVFSAITEKNNNLRSHHHLMGWKETNGEWAWIEDDPNYVPLTIVQPTATFESSSSLTSSTTTTATPKLPSGSYKPKQSLGQNYLKDPNTVAKIIRAFHADATTRYDCNGKKSKDSIATLTDADVDYIVELGSGAGALTDPLINRYGVNALHCIEIDVRSIELLRNKHPQLHIDHLDVLQINYYTIQQRRRTLKQQHQLSLTNANTTEIVMNHTNEEGLTVIGNLPYYITSQILFALADATHQGLIRTATITMQYEVGQRMFAHTCTKDYGILSVVFQIYCITIVNHFKIPPTVFYPQPKVDSILLGLHFVTPYQLQHERFCGVHPSQLRRVVTVTFQQRRKTIRNSIKSLLQDIYDNNATQVETVLNLPPLPVPDAIQELANSGNAFAVQQILLPIDWTTKRPEEIHPAQFIELTRLIYSGIPENDEDRNGALLIIDDTDDDDNNNHNNSNGENDVNNNMLGTKVWRKLKHGA